MDSMNMSSNMNQVAQAPFVIPQHYQSSPQHFFQQQFQQNWSHGPSSYNGSSSIMYAATSAPNNFVVTDSRRIQAMEITITHLQGLLSKEVQSNKAEREELQLLQKKVEISGVTINMLEKQLQKMLNEKQGEQEGVVTALENFLATKKELSAKQEELITAQEENNTLKLANEELEIKVAELTKEVEALKMCPKNGTVECAAGEGLLDKLLEPLVEKQDQLILKSKMEELKNELDAKTEAHVFLCKQFNELGKRHLFMVAYSAEQMYNDFTQKHEDFINDLKNHNDKSVTNEAKSMIQKTLNSIHDQINVIKKYREEFKGTIEILINRLDKNLVKVSDFNIRPPRPQFEIPIDSFDPMLEVISSMGCVDLDS